MAGQLGRHYPLIALQLVEGAPALARELYYALRAKDELGEVVLLVLHVHIAHHHALSGVGVELNLVANLHVTLWPTVGKVDELQQTHVLQTKLQLYLFLLFHMI